MQQLVQDPLHVAPAEGTSGGRERTDGWMGDYTLHLTVTACETREQQDRGGLVTSHYKQVWVAQTAKRSQRLLQQDSTFSLFFLQTQKKSKTRDSESRLHLLAVAALWSEPSLVARHAVVAAFVRDERLGPDGFVATVAGEAVLVPRRAVVLQHLGAWG